MVSYSLQVPSQHSTISSLSRSEEEEASSGTVDEDGSSSYRPTDDSSRDVFASFSTDPNLSSIAEEIHDIASRRKRTTTKPSQMRKRKIRRRRRRTTRKSTGNVTNAGGLVKRARRTLRKSTTRKRKGRKAVSTKKSTKRLRLNSTQRGIQEYVSFLFSLMTEWELLIDCFVSIFRCLMYLSLRLLQPESKRITAE